MVEIIYVHSQLITIHFSKAVLLEASVTRYVEILRKGYARPSFEADSAMRRWRMELGTFSTAYLKFSPTGLEYLSSQPD